MSLIHSALQKAQAEKKDDASLMPPPVLDANSFVKASAALEREQGVAIAERLHTPRTVFYEKVFWKRLDVLLVLIGSGVVLVSALIIWSAGHMHTMRSSVSRPVESRQGESGRALASVQVQPASLPSVVQLGTSSVFSLANAVPRAMTEFVCTGVIYDGEESVAIINRVLVAVGDTIEDAKVIEIKADSVTLEFLGKKVELKITNA